MIIITKKRLNLNGFEYDLGQGHQHDLSDQIYQQIEQEFQAELAKKLYDRKAAEEMQKLNALRKHALNKERENSNPIF